MGIGYGDDIDAARRLILETVKSVEGVLENPAPEALTVDLADFDVKIRVLYWTQPPRWANLIRVQDSVVKAIKTKLSEAGIDLPYPTSQVLLHDQTEDADGDRRQQREGWPAKPQDRSRPRGVSHVLGEYLGKLGNSTKSEDGGRSVR